MITRSRKHRKGRYDPNHFRLLSTQAQHMYAQGLSCRAIGNLMGYSPEYIRKLIPSTAIRHPSPDLQRIITELYDKYHSYTRVARELRLSSPQYVYAVINRRKHEDPKTGDEPGALGQH